MSRSSQASTRSRRHRLRHRSGQYSLTQLPSFLLADLLILWFGRSCVVSPIIGGVVGGLAFLGAVIALILIRKKQSRKDRYDFDNDAYGTIRRDDERGEK